MLTTLLVVVATAANPAPTADTRTPITAPIGWMQTGAADSLFRAGRNAFNDLENRRAAELYTELLERYPRSALAADALYYRAYALYRIGERRDLRAALTDLDRYERSYGGAPGADDARVLRTRVCGKLASTGDADCGQELVSRAEGRGNPPPGGRAPGAGPTGAPPGGSGTRSTSRDAEDERLMALNALMQMSPEQALPILRKVLADRSTSVQMREQAVFLISQKAGRDVVDVLLDVAKNDPSENVRGAAVFWLSQTRDPRVVDVLEGILLQSADRTLQDKAIFSLSQVSSQRASEVLRSYIERKDAPVDLRASAIHWLGQRTGDISYLRELYSRATEREIKDKIIFALSQSRGGRPTLLEIAKDTREHRDLRNQAIFWIGSGSSSIADLTALYGTLEDKDLKNQVIFAMTQSSDRGALDKLMEIARTDKDKEVRGQAIFWIGQSRDPRAVRFIEELINR
jgi:HEAT repeat protein